MSAPLLAGAAVDAIVRRQAAARPRLARDRPPESAGWFSPASRRRRRRRSYPTRCWRSPPRPSCRTRRSCRPGRPTRSDGDAVSCAVVPCRLLPEVSGAFALHNPRGGARSRGRERGDRGGLFVAYARASMERTLASSSCGENGFLMWSSAPASKPAAAAPSRTLAVRRRTGIRECAGSSRSLRVTS